MLETDTGVVALHDITEVVDEWLHAWVVLPVDIYDLLLTEGTLLGSGISATLWFLRHGGWG